MFCENCGKELPDGAAFCTGCGASMNGQTGATQPGMNQQGYAQPSMNQQGYIQPNVNQQGGYQQPYANAYQPAPRMVKKAPLSEAQRQKRNKLIIVIAIAVAAVVIVGVGIKVVTGVLANRAEKKDNELFQTYTDELDQNNQAAEEKFLAQFNMSSEDAEGDTAEDETAETE